MRALVVVESSFGNSRAVAEALADGLAAELGDADVRSVGKAPTELAGIELLVVGGPTHAFGMSRDQTRADAVRQGAPGDTSGPGIREWLAGLDPPARLPVATFDTPGPLVDGELARAREWGAAVARDARAGAARRSPS